MRDESLQAVAIDVLSRHIGAGSGIDIERLTAEVNERAVRRFGQREAGGNSERRVRRAVEQLRRAGHAVCAHPSEGYYIAATAEELDRTCVWLTDRALTTLTQVAGMRRVALPDLYGQLGLRDTEGATDA